MKIGYGLSSLIIVSLVMVSPSLAQTDTECTGSGRYCFGSAVFECDNGVPQEIEDCPGSCLAGECVSTQLEPDIEAAPSSAPSPPASSYIIYIVLGIVFATMIILALKVKMRK